MFIYSTTLKMHDTDAAGRIYFANLLRIAHEAFETMMTQLGWDVKKFAASGDIVLPIVHTSADYTAPLGLGDAINVEVSIGKIGDTSFTSLYRFIKNKNIAAGSAQIVHVAVNRQTGQPLPLPTQLCAALKQHN